jgi:PAS domain S-box-containing protein
MADTAPVMIWRSGTDKGYDFFNQRWLDFRGRTFEQEAGRGWLAGVHPQDLTATWETYARAFDARRSFHMEYRLRRFDGEYCWVLNSGVPRVAPDGRYAGYIGSCIDITDIKRAEQEMLENQATLQASNKQILDLFGRLIGAQETERTRIARDLHDDVSQRIAGLSIMLSGIKHRLSGHTAEADVVDALASVQQNTIELANEIRHLSHDLHPALLQHAGLVTALRAHCGQFEKLHAITINYRADEDLGHVDPQPALCLYRIAQEALRNVVKHADARHVAVTVSRTTDGVELAIDDDGKGFDLSETRARGAGLGLVSIDERVRLLCGSVHVETQPRKGTRMRVRIPQTQPMLSDREQPSVTIA